MATGKPALTKNDDSDLVITCTFDVSSSISNGETVTELDVYEDAPRNNNQKKMVREALQAINDVTKIKFVEVNSSTAS